MSEDFTSEFFNFLFEYFYSALSSCELEALCIPFFLRVMVDFSCFEWRRCYYMSTFTCAYFNVWPDKEWLFVFLWGQLVFCDKFSWVLCYYLY
jgi:hypothetical protein